MKPFNLKKLAGCEPASFIFTCSQCNKTASREDAVLGCSCGNRLFRAARYMPLMDNPTSPYHSDPDEDGYKLTTPGDVSTSVGGQTISVIPQDDPDGTHGTMPADGTAGEEFGIPGATSDFMLPEHMKDRNIKQNQRPGVHNMNSDSINSGATSVFEQTRHRLWPHTNKRKNV